jgi:hypothetical protein
MHNRRRYDAGPAGYREKSSVMAQDEDAPTIFDLPVGLDATGMRHESDSLGRVEVPADRYWGAQTQRSLRQAFNPDSYQLRIVTLSLSAGVIGFQLGGV